MNRWLLFFLLALTGLRLFLGSQNELSPDEAYYYQWSERLDWAYFSKGPGVAAAIRMGTALLGPTELGVRLLSPFLALGTSLILFALAKRLYSESVATWTVVFMNLVPIFQAGGLVMTIDPLSIFFWSAAMLTFWLALERTPQFSWYWPLTGLMMALGFLSKYTNALQLLSVVLVLAAAQRYRKEFLRPGFWSLVGVFLLGVIPPLIWNQQHGWVTVDHLQDDGGLKTGFALNPLEVLVFLGLHFGVYSPLIFGAMLVALVWGCREARVHQRARFLVLFALPLIVMYVALSFKKAGQPNWTAPAMVSLGILTMALWHRWAEEKAWARRYAVAALLVGAVMSLALVNTDALRRVGFAFPYSRDPAARLKGWKTVAIAVDGLRSKMEQETGKPLFLIAERYQTVSSLAFYLPNKRVEGPGHPPVYVTESQAITNQYAFWPRYDQHIDLVEQAKLFIPTVTDPEQKAELVAAMTNLEKAGEGDDKPMLRATLIRELLRVNPSLPIDEYASEEVAIGLFYGRDALYVNDSGGNRIPTAIERGFEKVDLVALWAQERWGEPLRVIRVYHCRNYRGLSL